MRLVYLMYIRYSQWYFHCEFCVYHYNDVIMSTMASQITSLTIVYSAVYSGADQKEYESSPSLAFVRGIHRWPVNSPHKWPLTRKMFPVDDVIIFSSCDCTFSHHTASKCTYRTVVFSWCYLFTIQLLSYLILWYIILSHLNIRVR